MFLFVELDWVYKFSSHREIFVCDFCIYFSKYLKNFLKYFDKKMSKIIKPYILNIVLIDINYLKKYFKSVNVKYANSDFNRKLLFLK